MVRRSPVGLDLMMELIFDGRSLHLASPLTSVETSHLEGPTPRACIDTSLRSPDHRVALLCPCGPSVFHPGPLPPAPLAGVGPLKWYLVEFSSI